MFDLRPFVDRYGLPDDLSGQRALDVGTFDGFWAFELERRGAEVVAIDVDRIHDLDWPPRLRPAEDAERGERFRIAHEALRSSVKRIGGSVYETTPEALGGSFDLVFCGSILIHLRDPLLALERMATLCRGRFVMAEEYSRRLERLPFGPVAEFRGETPHSTWWRPTTRGWMAMARCAGFQEVRHHGRFQLRFRERLGGVPHTVIHARRPAARS
jgi:tRNA (mo5U34)-methyltransferase